jgi:hypothetical protein
VISIVYYLIYGIIKNIVVVSFLFTNKNDPVTCLQSLFGTNMFGVGVC